VALVSRPGQGVCVAEGDVNDGSGVFPVAFDDPEKFHPGAVERFFLVRSLVFVEECAHFFDGEFALFNLFQSLDSLGWKSSTVFTNFDLSGKTGSRFDVNFS